MLTLTNAPPFLEEMEIKAKHLAQNLDKGLQDIGQIIKLTKESELLSFSPSTLIRIRQGIFRCEHDEKTIRLYSAGDFLLSPSAGESGGLTITSEFGSEITVIPHEVFIKILIKDENLLSDWIDYQNLETRIGHLLCSLYLAEDIKHQPEIRNYNTGEIIIRENETPVEIFEMVQGSAVVTLGDLKISKILPGEVFGELSFFTGLQRTASVTAEEPCLVQVIEQKQFLRIMKYRPALVEGMIRTLCQRLVDLNIRVAELK